MKKKRIFGIVACGMATFLLSGSLARARGQQGGAAPAGPEARLRKAIDEGNALFLETRKRGDAAGFAALFADDGALLGAGGEIIAGRKNIEEAMAGVMKSARLTGGTITTVDVFSMGDLAYETGKYSFTVERAATAPRTVTGRYVEIWKRQPDGSWKMYRDIGLPD